MRDPRRYLFVWVILLIILLLLFIFPTSSRNIKCLLNSKHKNDLQLQKKFREKKSKNEGIRRILRGPGSFPPRCVSKCGKCTPCKPVHVPMPPGTPVTAEYYPEAWRCKCGNRLYMP
ncbi:unnamed protein product [Amaranthus hypochondriacus]